MRRRHLVTFLAMLAGCASEAPPSSPPIPARQPAAPPPKVVVTAPKNGSEIGAIRQLAVEGYIEKSDQYRLFPGTAIIELRKPSSQGKPLIYDSHGAELRDSEATGRYEFDGALGNLPSSPGRYEVHVKVTASRLGATGGGEPVRGETVELPTKPIVVIVPKTP